MAPRKSVFFIVYLSTRSGHERTSEYARSTSIAFIFFFFDIYACLNDYNGLHCTMQLEFNVGQSEQFGLKTRSRAILLLSYN